MDKKLPKMYEHKLDKKINNNKLVYSSLYESESDLKINKPQRKEIRDNFTIEQKIYNILHSPNYIYKADVTVVTEEYTKKIRLIGKNNNNLITFDGEYIPINSIRDIYE